MAELKYCPNCNTSKECTKKGTNKAGKQLWYCKTCKKTFLPVETTTPATKPAAKKATKPTAKKATKPTGTTEIWVNNNSIKTCEGILTIDQAFELTKNYFKEVVKEKPSITDNGTNRKIMFKINAGTKG